MKCHSATIFYCENLPITVTRTVFQFFLKKVLEDFLVFNNLMPQKDPCKVFACKIQICLKENKFQESSCQHAIEDMRKCCRVWKEKSYVCQGINTEEKSAK